MPKHDFELVDFAQVYCFFKLGERPIILVGVRHNGLDFFKWVLSHSLFGLYGNKLYTFYGMFSLFALSVS